MYHISVADEHCSVLAAFLLNEEYTFVGVDINNDEKQACWSGGTKLCGYLEFVESA